MIVGGGLAAAKAARAYREAGGEAPVRILSSDSAPPYNRPPLSKRYLRGEIDATDTYVEPEGFYAAHGIELTLGVEVTAIGDGEVELADGERIPFGRLVVASGSSPRRHPAPGADREGVVHLRTLADSTLIRERAKTARRAVVVGSGFIGLEVAASLTALGVEVTLVDRGTQLLRPLQNPPLSAYLNELYTKKEVELLLGEDVAEFTGGEGVTGVRTASGVVREADFVVVGIGVTPNVGFLESSGIEVHGAVVVDERYETSVPGIHAVGDVAFFYDPIFGRHRHVEHWFNAFYQGDQVGKILAGQEARYDIVTSFMSEVFGLGLKFIGDAAGHDRIELDGSFAEGKAVALYLAGERIVAALVTGQDKETESRLTELVRSGAPLSAYR